MPQKYLKYKNPTQDGRVRLDPKFHQEIKDKYATGNYSWKNLADEYEVNKGTIGFLVSEKFRERVINYRKGRWVIYADKHNHMLAMRKYRLKKRKACLVCTDHVPLTEKVCEFCGKIFLGKKGKKYCGNNCKSAYHRKKRK